MSNKFFKRKKQTPLYHVECGPFIVNFYFKEESVVDSYMDIRSELGAWSMRIDARYEVYGYLLAAAQQGYNEQIHGFCLTMYIASTQMTKDQGFANDLQKSVTKYMKRLDKQAKAEAESVSEAQIAGDEALMQEAIERGELRGNKKAEKRAAKESRKAIKEVFESKLRGGTEIKDEK